MHTSCMLRFRHIRLGRIMESRANMFAFQQSILSSPTLSDEMIISDSEPERERERERLRRANGRSQPTTQRRQPVQPTRHKAPVKEGVIEISDDSTISGSNGSIIVLTGTIPSCPHLCLVLLTVLYRYRTVTKCRNLSTPIDNILRRPE